MLTTSKPIFALEYPSTSRVYTYLPYVMGMSPEVWDEQNQIYVTDTSIPYLYAGKVFIMPYDSDHGIINVEISEVINDYKWKWETEWDAERQKYLPVFSTIEDPSQLGENYKFDIHPIEIEKHRIYNCPVSIIFGNNLYAWGRPVTPAFTLPQIGDPYIEGIPDVYNSLDDDGYGMFIWNGYYMSDGSGDIKPRIPYVDTQEYWLGFQFGLGQNAKLNDIKYTITNGQIGIVKGIELKNNDAGNYSICISLEDLYSKVENIDRTGRVAVIEERGISREQVVPIVNVDVDCPADYYISWMTPWQTWQSQPFKGRTVKKQAVDNRVIEDPFGNQKMISGNELNRFVVNSGIVGERMYNLLSTIPMSYVIYLYDVNADKGYYVRCTDTQISTQIGNRNLQLNLEEIRENRY